MNSTENGIHEALTEQEQHLFGSLLDLTAEKVPEYLRCAGLGD